MIFLAFFTLTKSTNERSIKESAYVVCPNSMLALWVNVCVIY